MIWKVFRRSGKFPDDLMHKILQNHLLCAFVANLKIDAIYALYPESFCDPNLAIRKVFAFSDSGKQWVATFEGLGFNFLVNRKRKDTPLPEGLPPLQFWDNPASVQISRGSGPAKSP